MSFLSDCVEHFGTRSLYDVLNVAEGRDASEDQIRLAYKQACLKLHPDKTPEGSTPENTTRFQLFQRAYAVLSDPQRRAHYDRTGRVDDWSWPVDPAEEEVDEEDLFAFLFPFPFVFHFVRGGHRRFHHHTATPATPPGGCYDNCSPPRGRYEPAAPPPPRSRREPREPSEQREQQVSLADADFTRPFGDLADVVFSVEGKRLYFNRDFLAKRSAVFAKMFQAAGKEAAIKLKKLRYDDVLAALKLLVASESRYLYKPINKGNLKRLLELSVALGLKEVRDACERFIVAEWKVREDEMLEAVLLSEKFDLKDALKDLLSKLGDHYSSIVRDKNIEQVLTIATKYKLGNVLTLCENYILKTWKQQPAKFVRTVELAGKFGLRNVRVSLFGQSSKANQGKVSDANVEELLSLAKLYELSEVRTRCESYIMGAWIRSGDKALRAVKIGHEMNLPKLTKAFIPLAAKRPMTEIQKENLSPELQSAILESAGLLKAEGGCVGRGRQRSGKK